MTPEVNHKHCTDDRLRKWANIKCLQEEHEAQAPSRTYEQIIAELFTDRLRAGQSEGAEELQDTAAAANTETLQGQPQPAWQTQAYPIQESKPSCEESQPLRGFAFSYRAREAADSRSPGCWASGG